MIFYKILAGPKSFKEIKVFLFVFVVSFLWCRLDFKSNDIKIAGS